MGREQPSRSNSCAGTEVLERPAAPNTQPGPNVDALEMEQFHSSSTAARVQNLLAVTLSFPDHRMARVQALKAQIDAGTYQVSAKQVSAALLDYMRLQTG